jgi:hypothetical protein
VDAGLALLGNMGVSFPGTVSELAKIGVRLNGSAPTHTALIARALLSSDTFREGDPDAVRSFFVMLGNLTTGMSKVAGAALGEFRGDGYVEPFTARAILNHYIQGKPQLLPVEAFQMMCERMGRHRQSAQN